VELDSFIEQNFESILIAWRQFAEDQRPAASQGARAGGMDEAEFLSSLMERLGSRDEACGSFDAGPSRVEPVVKYAESYYAAGLELGALMAELRHLREHVMTRWLSKGDLRDSAKSLVAFNGILDDALVNAAGIYAAREKAGQNLFMAVLAHDLRNPLQGITMASRLLASPSIPDGTRMETARRLLRATSLMSALIADFLDYGRLRLGVALPINAVVCDLVDSCERALEIMRTAEPGREFAARFSGTLRVRADPVRVTQALLNLLRNAVQHGDPSSRIAVEGQSDGDEVSISVSNAGKSIPEAVLGGIFEPLVRDPSTSSAPDPRSTTSLGIGLFMVREIAQSHRGSVSAQSADGRTIFTIRLPRLEA
jgi:hypothetical protein